ncbi:hypothetical protein [Longimicrobium sp.]|uniref:hypothetical protein n=1 Tax=Longimicrobium sp. TaxID=2029185 RepID=UPI002B527B56|nr:hypothetical protein [Longimicrobium sp.]HSU14556.1 hypothetical protein [Longimicrobium sp.]
MASRAALPISILLLLLSCPGPRVPEVRAAAPVYRAPATLHVVAPPAREIVSEQVAPYGWVVQLRRLRGPLLNRWRVTVDGREVLSAEMASLGVSHVLPARDGVLVLLEVTPGGVACEFLYRVLELRYEQPPRITDEFGTCAAPADVRLVHGRLRVYTGPYLPTYIGLMDPQPSGIHPEPARMDEYRDGRMVPVARGAAADRLGGR